MALSWVIAGGGTGGHVVPALALGEEIARRGDRITFIGSEFGLESRMVPEAGFELITLRSRQVMGQQVVGKILGVLGILASVGGARRALAKAEADCVISVGGYAAMPVVLACALTRTPLALLETNAIPGRVNRLSARLANKVFVGFEAAARSLDPRFDPERPRKVELAGIPLRRGMLDAIAAAAEAGKRREPPHHLLVFGGSQGARQINEAVLEAIPALAALPLEVFHQTGEADRSRLEQAYRKHGVAAEVVAFERDMPSRYAWADLALCRAGAQTIAELAAAGLPALLVPYPFAADDHQSANARELTDAGAARMLASKGEEAIDGERLTSALTSLLEDPEALTHMSAAASARARPDATRIIVERFATTVTEGR